MDIKLKTSDYLSITKVASKYVPLTAIKQEIDLYQITAGYYPQLANINPMVNVAPIRA